MKIFLTRPIDGDLGAFHANTIQDFPDKYFKQLEEAGLGRKPTKRDFAKAKGALTHSPLAKAESEAAARARKAMEDAADETDSDADEVPVGEGEGSPQTSGKGDAHLFVGDEIGTQDGKAGQ